MTASFLVLHRTWSVLHRNWAALAIVVAVATHGAVAHAFSPEHDAISPEVRGTHGPTHTGIEWITNPFPMFLAPEQDKIGLLWLFINFAVLMLVLEKLLFRPLRKRTHERHASVRDELARATRAREEAERIMATVSDRMDQLDDERESLLQAARERAEADRELIVERAHAEAERIRISARQAAEREAQVYLREIEQEIVDQAVERAETLLRAQFGGQDQARLVERHVGDVFRTDFGRGER